MQNPGFKFEYFSKSIKYKDFNISTYVIGSGEKTVLSLPSFPHSGLYYLWFLNHYFFDKVKFLTLDFPGWIGFSDNIFANSKFDIEEYVKLVKHVVHTYKLKKFSLLGYSYGGALAVRLAHELPNMVDRIVLVSPVIDSSIIQNTKEVRLVNLLKKSHLEPLIKAYLYNRWKAYRPIMLSQGLPSPFAAIYAAMIQQASSQVILDSLYTLFKTNWSPYLSALEDKQLLIINSRSEGKMFRKQAELLRRKFGGKSSFYPGGHEDFILKPKSEVVRDVITFLSQH